MTVWNLGSINADHFYAVPRIPAPGETIAAQGYRFGLGGKGANQSVAVARAGAVVHHIGAVGADGGWAVERLASYGVGVDHVAEVEAPTGHAIINVDPVGENAIVILPGANIAQSPARIAAALAQAAPGDLMVLQNETNGQREAAQAARTKGMRVVYSAAPFEAEAVAAMLPLIDLLLLNSGEAAALQAAVGAVDVADMVVTRGADGVAWHHAGRVVEVPSPRVRAVDTTGAGDTFAGYLVAGLDQGLPMEAALARAVTAAALKVTRPGTADAIPSLAEVMGFTP